MRWHGCFLTWAVVIGFPASVLAVDFDADGDGRIDLSDYVAFADCLAGPAVPAGPGCDGFDENGDGLVDLHDFAGFQAAFGSVVPAPIVALQLAGVVLDEFPFFAYVRAFNANGPIDLAIDPARYPGVADQTCDVYVVAARTAGEWSVDPDLADVRPDGPQTVTFGGMTIQDNTVRLTDGGVLDADAGVGFGVGYDVVLDCDQDGTLSGGDWIDGLGREAGLYVVHDTTQSGPLAVSETTYSGGPWLGQKTYYPTAIDTMEPLPLIVVSHGNGHDYRWYDYLGRHMASYGYIVMAHENNTGPGIESASTTTLTNTDYLIGNQDIIAGGVLDGHIDSHRIVWIGHSRGGEGVCRAYSRVYDGSYTPDHFVLDDVVLVSSISPNDYLGRFSSNPHDVNFHLLQGAADGDNGGWPDRESDAPFHVYERAIGYRQLTYVHGADHNDFNCCGFNDFEGPPGTEIGREEAQKVAKGVYLALVKHYVEGNLPAKDFLWRQYESLRPIGVAADTIVDLEYIEGPGPGVFVIDDYQSNPSESVSSSGGAVTFTVEDLWEGQLDDTDGTFTWTGGDPMNGMVRGRTDDLTKGVVFSWNGDDRYVEFEVISTRRDFSDDVYLSFRACQGTRHPLTAAALEDLTFGVTLRDGAGVSSTIRIGAYGGGIEEPYQRTGSGSGAGWQNEFETIRIRLTDFLHNGSGLDLTDVVAVRIDVGPSFGSAEGRLGLDDLAVSKDHPPLFVPPTISLPDGVPEFVAPGEATVMLVEIDPGTDTLVPGTEQLHYRFDAGAFTASAMAPIGGDLYEATLPAAACGDSPSFYFSVQGAVSGAVVAPVGAPGTTYASGVGTLTVAFDEDFETDRGWTVESIDLTDGAWERGLPAGDGTRGDPVADFDGSGRCYLTGNRAGNSDVDGGPTRLTSPMLDLTGLTDPVLRYARWFTCDDAGSEYEDYLTVEVSDDDGASWVTIEVVPDVDGWLRRDVRLLDSIDLTATVRLRFDVMDNPNDSVTESAIDAVTVFDVTCE